MGREWDSLNGREDAGFAYWLAGFIDGEGCFRVQRHERGTYSCTFSINVRRDERGTLESVKRFLGVGTISEHEGSGNANPLCRYVIQDKAGCIRLVQVLDKYPLRAKKRLDYDAWAQAVSEWSSMKRGNRWSGPSDWTRMAALKSRIENTRQYVEPPWSGNEFQDWCRLWATECLRILKPGGHLLAFGGSRTWHRLSSGIEDAGFEIRDSIAWLYGSGFPKSMDVSKAIASTELGYGGNSVAQRKATMGDNYVQSGRQGNRDGAGRRDTGLAEHTLELTESARAWQGWGTALKPAFEPIVVARKPLAGTVAANVLAHGTGALNIDGCRIATTEDCRRNASGGDNGLNGEGAFKIRERRAEGQAERDGRWPTNVVLDGDQAEALDRQTGVLHSGAMRAGTERRPRAGGTIYGADTRNFTPADTYGDSGGASRFFPVFRYEAKAPTSERPSADGVHHPTVKPLDLMRWLVRLVTPAGALVLEPFAGSGTTAEACVLEDRRCIAIEREAEYLPLIVSRLRKPVQQGLFGLEAGA
nr:DNA methyltransferase [Mycobacteroides abscessus]